MTPGWQRAKKSLETSNELMAGGDRVLWEQLVLIHLGEDLGYEYAFLVSTNEETDMQQSPTLYYTQFGQLSRGRMQGR